MLKNTDFSLKIFYLSFYFIYHAWLFRPTGIVDATLNGYMYLKAVNIKLAQDFFFLYFLE